MIVATAGHVDHGKTALVRALTGTDTDRLPEEKRRGLSIDLGYAFLRRPGAGPVAFIDVPGHERFVRNMAAGVHAIDLALLVVAADDGPMPQTREHLAILDLLGAPRLAAVLTKIDRVPAERLAAARIEVDALLATTRFRGAPVMAVSAVTGTGLDGLADFLAGQEVNGKAERPRGRFRMYVDREFVIDGLGLVVTGTALAGAIAPGEAVTILPQGRRARVRSLRANNAEAPGARAGERCALALHGVSRGEVTRGDVVVAGEGAPCGRRLDVTFEALHERPKRALSVSVQLGTRALPAQLAPLGEGFARLAFSREVCAWHGDRYLVRESGSQRLIGGGAVVDPAPPERGAAKPARLALLRAVTGQPAARAFAALLELDAGVVDLDWLAAAWNLTDDEAHALAVPADVVSFRSGARRHVMSASGWKRLCDRVVEAIAAWHAEHPDWIGIRLQALRKSLGGAAVELVLPVSEALVAEGTVRREGAYFRLPGHQPVLTPEDEALWRRIGPRLEGDGVRPPRVHELAEALSLEPHEIAAFLERAARAGRCYRIAANRFFLPEAVARLSALAVRLDTESAGEGFGAAQYRDASGLGRNLTIQVLEFLDQIGCTRRRGELRRALADTTIAHTEEQRTPVGRPDFKSGERRDAPLASSTPASSATNNV